MSPTVRGLALLLILAGCSPAERTGESTSGGDTTVVESTETAAVPGSPPCPAATFEEFLARFASDSVAQRAWTHTPLLQSRVEQTAEEPETVADTVAAGELRFPLFPSDEQRAAENREVQVEPLPDGQWSATVYLPDSDWIVRYTFTAVSGCWWLSRIDDLSL